MTKKDFSSTKSLFQKQKHNVVTKYVKTEKDIWHRTKTKNKYKKGWSNEHCFDLLVALKGKPGDDQFVGFILPGLSISAAIFCSIAVEIFHSQP